MILNFIRYVWLATLLLTPIAGMAQGYYRYSTGINKEWLKCQSDQECVKIDNCGDTAINKNYLDQFKEQFRGCDASSLPNPNAITKCKNNKCAIEIPGKQ